MNLGARMAAWSGLPYDAQVEYLQQEHDTSGELCYFKTGIFATNNTKVTTRVKFITGINTFTLFGGRYSWSKDAFYCGYWGSPLSFATAVNNSGAKPDRGVALVSLDTELELSISNESGFKVGDTTYISSYGQGTFTIPYELYVMCGNTNGAPLGTYGRYNMYSFKVEESGVTIMDLIPVRKMTNGINYGLFYDKITRRILENYGGAIVGNRIGPDLT